MELWQIAIVALIILIPAAAAVGVTIWTVPRPGDRYQKTPPRRIDTSRRPAGEDDDRPKGHE